MGRCLPLGDRAMLIKLIQVTVSNFCASVRSATNCPKPLMVRCVLLVLLALTLRLPAAQAQVSASIRGIVTDATGSPVAQVTVTSKNLETGAGRASNTDDAGRYLVLTLPVGKYEVRVSKSGFQDAVQSGIHLVVGEEASVDLRLQL